MGRLIRLAIAGIFIFYAGSFVMSFFDWLEGATAIARNLGP